jgi:hypothetical protein
MTIAISDDTSSNYLNKRNKDKDALNNPDIIYTPTNPNDNMRGSKTT